MATKVRFLGVVQTLFRYHVKEDIDIPNIMLTESLIGFSYRIL